MITVLERSHWHCFGIFAVLHSAHFTILLKDSHDWLKQSLKGILEERCSTSLGILKNTQEICRRTPTRKSDFNIVDLGLPILNELPPLPLSNKLWNNNPNVHVNERNQNKNESKSRHIQIDETFYCSIQPTNNAMVSLKDGFTIWHQSQKEDFLLIIY